MASPESRYKILSELGQGSYGRVCEALDVQSNVEVAIKIGCYSLQKEADAYVQLHKNWSPFGIPKLFAYFYHDEYLVMEKLGKSVKHYWKLCGRRFSLKTLVMLGVQMISRLETVHNRGLVHSDIKDDNFVMGGDVNSGTVYIIDFGLATSFVDRCTGMHIQKGRDPYRTGTVYYSSINTHKKCRASRRDDIESLGYMLIRLLTGSLPWADGECDEEFKVLFQKAGRRKVETSLETLCQSTPAEMKEFIAYARGLGFDERPNYCYLKDLLRRALQSCHLNNDGIFDWMAEAAAVYA